MSLDMLRRTLEDYAALRAQHGAALPALVPVAVTVTPEDPPLDGALFDRVRTALGEGPAVTGWCRFRSALGWSGNLPANVAEAGPPLVAEWVAGPRVSCRLLPNPDGPPGTARLWTYAERPLRPGEAPEPDEMPLLRERRRLLAGGGFPAGRLLYHVFWGAEEGVPPGALRRLFDRPAGYPRARA